MSQRVTPADEGKRIVTTDGDVVGAVESIRDGVLYVRPKRGLLGSCGSWISDAKVDETFPLDSREVAEVTEVEIRLARPKRDRVE